MGVKEYMGWEKVTTKEEFLLSLKYYYKYRINID
jgi:hypothetical protein